jgi:putative membrane protein
MKKIVYCSLMALAVCFGSSCENKGGGDNYSTSTEKVGSGEGDELNTEPADNASVQTEASTDSTQITTGNPPIPTYTSDADFVATAASGGLMEVELGKIAAQKGASAEVKKFGQHMVDDHSKANTELKQLAAKKKWNVPAKMNAENQATYDRLSKMNGKDFDRDYMAEMVKDHTVDVGLFEQATRKAKDADLKAFASKTTPTLRNHLDMAREINAKTQNQK